MKIIKHRERVETKYYYRKFECADDRGSGAMFECDEAGIVDRAKLPPAALKNLEECLTGRVTRRVDVRHRVSGDGEYESIPGTGREIEVKMIDLGAVEYRHSYVEPAIGKCDCGTEVELCGFTNTCTSCEADYNSSGQRLAPREFWGEETGESVSDILSVDWDTQP